MLRALGIDEAALRRSEPILLGTMQDACEQCVVVGRCKYAIYRGIAVADYAQFCPNAASLTDVRKRQADPAELQI